MISILRNSIIFIAAVLFLVIASHNAYGEDCIKLSLPTPAVSQINSQFPARNVVDNNLSTRWQAAQSVAWVAFDLGEVKKICNAEIAWYQGDKMRYPFSIHASVGGGVPYQKIYSNITSGKTLALEKYTFATVSARYIAVMVTNPNAALPVGITELALSQAATASASSSDPILGYDHARLLLFRTGFSASHTQVNEFAQLRRSQAVDRILAGVRTTPTITVPSWVNTPIPNMSGWTSAQINAYNLDKDRHTAELPLWWYREMLSTTSPFTEKMTLFWHSHFGNSLEKIHHPELMYKQNALYRSHALGNFRTMLHAIAKDPGMLIMLDGAYSTKWHPNENFAREVMELFTLGEEKFTQTDVSEAARAFTGWTIDPITRQYKPNTINPDTGVKTILGKTGNFDGDAALDILLEQPAAAEFITTKLWKEFISYTPDISEVKRLAAIFRVSYDIKALMRAMLTSDHFYSPQNRAILFKSPIDLIVGTIRQFDIRLDDLRPLFGAGEQLGQTLLYPPNIRGWPGGDTWINSATLAGRYQILGQMFSQLKLGVVKKSDGTYMSAQEIMNLGGTGALPFDIQKWLSQFPLDKQQRYAAIERLLAPMTPVENYKTQADELEFLRLLALDQVYQLQ